MRRAALPLLACAALAVATPVQAQIPGVDLKLMPKVGAFMPLSDLTSNGEGTGLEPDVALGLAVEFGIMGIPNFRANLDFATGTSFDTENGGIDPDADISLIAVTGDLVLKRDILGPVTPYALVGLGVKLYDLGDFADDEKDLTAHLGVGVDVGLGVLGFFVEVSDYISSFSPGEGADSKLQNDIFAMAGVKVGIL